MRNVARVSALLIVACLFLCCCSAPYAERAVTSKSPTYFDIYVSGAVEKDGCFSVIAGSDYGSLLTLAGTLDGLSAVPDYISRFVTPSFSEVIVGYVLDGVTYDSVNVNGALIIARLPVDNVEYRIVNKLADYLETYGTVTNRDILRKALGSDYESSYYKFFISRQDYA